MEKLTNPSIKLKESLNIKDYEEINILQKLCLQHDQTELKLELDYKLKRVENKSEGLNSINEFMYYIDNKLVGYIGICNFDGTAAEINGMVHPDCRRRGVFTKLSSLVKDEWRKRAYSQILLLCDHSSASGQEFIKSTGAVYHNSEYEMYLRDDWKQDFSENNVILRKARNQDAKEIARQNSIYFDEAFNEEDISLPEEEEKYGWLIFLAEADGKTIGKVHLDAGGKVGGIYGLGVIPEYRKKGYGREILIQSIKKLAETGIRDVKLQVAVKNKTALNIYKSCGFEETSTMDYYEMKQ